MNPSSPTSPAINNLQPGDIQEWTKDSGVAIDIVEACVKRLKGDAALRFCNVPRSSSDFSKAIEKGGWTVSGLDPSNNWENSSWGQFKADKPASKKHKYLSRSGVPVEALLLHGEGTFPMERWKAVQADPTQPVVEIEGAKKSAALLTLGIAAIGLAGIWQGQKPKKTDPKRDLIDYLRPFAQPKRVHIIAFDEESPENAQASHNVELATNSLAKTLKRHGCVIKIARWHHSEGKGIDDVLVNRGPERVRQIINEADLWLDPADEEIQELRDTVAALQHRPVEVDSPDSLPYHSKAIESISGYYNHPAIIQRMALRCAVAGQIPSNTRLSIGVSSFEVKPILWALFIGPKSIAKTGYEGEVMEPLWDVDLADEAQYKKAKKRDRQRLEEYKMQCRSSRKNDPTPTEPEPEAKRRRHIIAKPASTQALGRIAANQPGYGSLLYSHEIASFIQNLEPADRTTMLEARDGAVLDSVTKGGEGTDVGGTARTSFSWVGSTQPSKLKQMFMADLTDDGFWDRFLVCRYNYAAKLPRTDRPRVSARDLYAGTFDLISQHRSDRPEVKFRLSPEAEGLWGEIQDWFEQQLEAEDEDAWMRGPIGKYRNYVLQVAFIDWYITLTHRAAEDGAQLWALAGSQLMPREYIQAAWDDVRYCLQESRSLFGQEADDEVDPTAKAIEKLLKKADKQGRRGIGAQLGWTDIRKCLPKIKNRKTGRWDWATAKDKGSRAIIERICKAGFATPIKRDFTKIELTDPTQSQANAKEAAQLSEGDPWEQCAQQWSVIALKCQSITEFEDKAEQAGLTEKQRQKLWELWGKGSEVQEHVKRLKQEEKLEDGERVKVLRDGDWRNGHSVQGPDIITTKPDGSKVAPSRWVVDDTTRELELYKLSHIRRCEG